MSQGGESLPALWALGHPEAPQRGLEIGHKRLALPSQDNHCDCGLFLLTYTDYFTHSLPAAIRTKSRSRLEPPELEGRGLPSGLRTCLFSKQLSQVMTQVSQDLRGSLHDPTYLVGPSCRRAGRNVKAWHGMSR